MNICDLRVYYCLYFQDELQEAKKAKKATELEVTKSDIPGMYKTDLPFDNFKRLEEWDGTVFSGDVLPEPKPGEDPSVRKALEEDKQKFDRFVSYFVFYC